MIESSIGPVERKDFEASSTFTSTRGFRVSQLRHVTDLKPAGGMHYSVPRTVIPAGVAFEWEFELVPNAATSYIFGDSDSTNPETGRLIFTGGWGGILSGSPINATWYSDNSVHKLNISRANNTITLTIDGVFEASKVNGGEITFNGFGNKFGGFTTVPTFSGSFFSSKLTVPSNAVLNHDHRFDDTNGILVDYSKPLGAELWGVRNYFPANSGIATVVESGKVFDVQAIGYAETNLSQGASIVFNSLTVGETYIYSVDSSEPVNISVYDGAFSNVAYKFNANKIVFTAVATNRLYVTPRNNNVVRISNPSLRKAEGYGQAVNVTASDRELMTFDSARNAWLGENIANARSLTANVTLNNGVWTNSVAFQYLYLRQAIQLLNSAVLIKLNFSGGLSIDGITQESSELEKGLVFNGGVDSIYPRIVMRGVNTTVNNSSIDFRKVIEVAQ